MTTPRRHTADTITDDALEQLYDQLEAATAIADELRAQLDLTRRALNRADALTDQWAGDMTTTTRSAAADLYATVLELHGWTETDPPTLHTVPTDHSTEDVTQ